MIATGSVSEGKSTGSDSLGTSARQELRRVLHEQSEWVKVHAAEYLLWAGFPEGVKTVFLEEEKRFGHQSPYRIGIWRVLVQGAATEDERKKWLGCIQMAFQDTAGPDRIHAAETLAKLRTPPTATSNVTRQAIHSDNKALSFYTRWAAAYQSADSAVRTRHYFLDALTEAKSSSLTKRMSAYILRHLGQMTDAQWRQLAQTALAEPDTTDVKTYLLSTAFVQAPASEEAAAVFKKIRQELLNAQHSPRKGDRTEMAMALAKRGTPNELPVLVTMLKNQNPLGVSSGTSPEELRKNPDNADVRAAAAFAILKIQQRFK